MIKIKRKVATLEENIYPPHSIFNNERKLTLQTIKETIWPVVSFSYGKNDELIFTQKLTFNSIQGRIQKTS